MFDLSSQKCFLFYLLGSLLVIVWLELKFFLSNSDRKKAPVTFSQDLLIELFVFF